MTLSPIAIFRLLLLVALPVPVFGGENSSEEEGVLLHSLEYRAPVLVHLKGEIADNLKSVVRNGTLVHPLRFIRYVVQKGDNFYTIMARVSQDEDTLASANGIIHPSDLGPGDVLRIPNARGLFRKTDSKNPEGGIRVFQGELSFYPGRKKDPEERRLFRGRDFVPVLPLIRVTSGFGRRQDPFSNRASFHGGVDLGAPMNTPVFAAATGTVRFSGWRTGYGKLIVVDHGSGYETYYGHLNKSKVRVGDPVRAGETLGFVGQTGRATGPHLHFEVRKNGTVRRPTPFKAVDEKASGT